MKVRIKTNSFTDVQWDEIAYTLLTISEENDEGEVIETLVKGDWISVSPYIGAGEAKWISEEEIWYRTGSGKGFYILHKDGRVIFEGYRNSFISGTEFFCCTRERVRFYAWNYIELNVISYDYNSSDMSRDPWHVNYIHEEREPVERLITGRKVMVKRIKM
jgi:hypothetical protein